MIDDASSLSDEEQHLWGRWLRLSALLPVVLHRELQSNADLSLPDFDVLVQLTGSPDARIRVTDLARGLCWERSRVSHHVTRMERRGLVRREECRDDGRGAFVVLTEEGCAELKRAAPAHVAAVRRVVFDAITPQETALMATVIDKVLTRLEGDTAPVGT